METDVEKAKVARISRQPPPILLLMVDQTQPESLEYFRYFGSMITKEGRCTHED
jgi:hypothetical protein